MSPSTSVSCIIGTKVLEAEVHSTGMDPKTVSNSSLEHNLQIDWEVQHASPVCFCALWEYHYGSLCVISIMNLLKGGVEIRMYLWECDTYGSFD